jgi:hypothetical protein
VAVGDLDRAFGCRDCTSRIACERCRDLQPQGGQNPTQAAARKNPEPLHRSQSRNHEPIKLGELRKLRGFEGRSRDPEVEEQFAFKGEKGYARMRRLDIPEPAPVSELRPDATPMERSLHEHNLEVKEAGKVRDAWMGPVYS